MKSPKGLIECHWLYTEIQMSKQIYTTGAYDKLPWQGEQLRVRLETLLSQDLKEGLTVAPEELEALLGSPLSDAFFVVDPEAEALIGYAELHVWPSATGRAGYVENVVRDSAYVRQGIGNLLVAAIDDAVARRNLKTVWLHSSAWRVAAQELYRRSGFKRKRTALFFKNYGEAHS